MFLPYSKLEISPSIDRRIERYKFHKVSAGKLFSYLRVKLGYGKFKSDSKFYKDTFVNRKC